MFQVVPINMVQDVIMYDMSTRHIRYRELQFGCVQTTMRSIKETMTINKDLEAGISPFIYCMLLQVPTEYIVSLYQTDINLAYPWS